MMKKWPLIGATLFLLLGLLTATACGQKQEQPPSTEGEAPAPTTPDESQQEQPAQAKSEGKIVFSTSDNIHIIDPDGSNEVRLTEGHRPVWSPDGKRIAFYGVFPDSGIFVIDVDGTDRTEIITRSDLGIETDNYDLAGWSPDGQRLLVLVDYFVDAEGLYSVNRDGTGLTRLLEGPIKDAVFSPDGKKIAYAVQTSSGGTVYDRYLSLYLVDSDGTGRTRLSEDELTTMWGSVLLNWSPDGKRISYISGASWSSVELYVMNVDGSDKIKFATEVIDHTWSPDGQKIAYCPNRALEVANYDGTGRISLARVEQGTHLDPPPSWSPDAQRIVFTMDEDIYIVNSDGSGLTKLVQSAGRYPWAQWSPAAR